MLGLKLFHFSDDPGIEVFVPRAVLVPSPRPPGREWLNGPLVWAIAEDHQMLYLFPRDCPRILAWALPQSLADDRARWLGQARAVAYIERGWLDRLNAAFIYRYELERDGFESLEDAGMFVSRHGAQIIGRERIDDLPAALRHSGVALRVVDNLSPLKALWETTLHVSGIRLRNAASWQK